MASATSPYMHHAELVAEIESRFAAVRWRAGDIDLWPIACQDLFLHLFREANRETAPTRPPFVVRAASCLATPATNLWSARHDLDHWEARPRRADAIVLGDGVSLDLVDGAWRDRYGEPIARALERQGRTCFFMQSGNLTRLPWLRRTYAANRIAARAAVRAAFSRAPRADLPDHTAILALLREAGVITPALAVQGLLHRARIVATQAAIFDRILRRVRPRVAFVVSYYAGLGHAFALACRRQGILCVDLQHCPHDAIHRAYRWSSLPTQGYSTLPGLFWSWTEADAANIRRWSDALERPWHAALAGGHTQAASLVGDDGERLWQHASAAVGDGQRYEREILVTLQPIGGKRGTWAALAKTIARADPAWRWWIRRHPASTVRQDKEFEALFSLARPGVVVGEPSQAPLPALLRHMDAQVSLASGASAEAAMFSVPAFFLDSEARDTFPGLLASGAAKIVEPSSLLMAIASLPPRAGDRSVKLPDIGKTLAEVDCLAADYARLCAEVAG